MNPEVKSKENHKRWSLLKIGLIVGALAVGSDLLLGHYLRAGLGPKH